MNRSSFGRRAAAATIDVAAIWLLAIASAKVGEFVERMLPMRPTRMQAVQGWLMLVVVPPLVVLAYTVTEAFWSLTLGKKLLKLRVANSEGQRASTGRLLRRWALKNAPLLIMAAWSICISAIVLTKQGAPRWLDSVAPAMAILIAGLLGFVVLSFLLAARTERESFYDWLTGTAVYNAAAITEQPAFEPVMSEKI